jgi:uncharacterized protein
VARRSSRIDALRGLAVFGILLVNVWGFVYGYSLFTVSAHSALSAAGELSVFFVAAFAEQKFYPVFAFLFGAGFALQTGGLRAPGPALDAVKATYLRRIQWLLVVGLLHGILLWFGDILFAYAVTGLWLVNKAGRKLSDLANSLRVLVVVNIAIVIGYGAATLAFFDGGASEIAIQVHDALAQHAAFTQGSWGDAALARLQNFGANVMGFLVFVPRLALLFMLGVFAVRRGWLTRPEQHRGLWRKVLIIGLAFGLPLNQWWGLLSVAAVADPFHPPPGYTVFTLALDVYGPLLAAAIVATFMLARERFCALLIPVGKMALTNYLGQSVILMLLLQGFGLGLGAVLTHAQLMVLCATVMLAQLAFSHWWLARHAQGPVEALWRRHTYASR